MVVDYKVGFSAGCEGACVSRVTVKLVNSRVYNSVLFEFLDHPLSAVHFAD
jgi:hypothetical protein